jgi:hypothetical protein
VDDDPFEALQAPALHYERTFRADRHALRDVRDWVASVLSEHPLGSERVVAAVLVASELVANVVRHGESETVVVDVFAGVDELRVAVTADAGGVVHFGASGAGRRLIDKVARSWSVVEHASGETVVVFVRPDV